jgi:hypothetical protein
MQRRRLSSTYCLQAEHNFLSALPKVTTVALILPEIRTFRHDRLLVLIAIHLDIPCLLKYCPNCTFVLYIFFFVHKWYLKLIISETVFRFKISRPKHFFTCFNFSNSLRFLRFRITKFARIVESV